MKKLALVLTMVLSVSMIGGCGKSESNKTTNSSKETKTTEATEEQEKDKVPDDDYFVYDIEEYINSYSEEYWEDTEEWFDLYSNREALEIRWKETPGGFMNGKLATKPVGFSETIEIGSVNCSYFDITVADSKFLLPSYLKVMEDRPGNVDSKIDFYIMMSDFYFDRVSFSIDNLPIDGTYPKGEWVIVQTQEDVEDALTTNAYYNLNDEYCLELSFPSALGNKTLEGLDKEEVEAYKEQNPISEEEVKELAEKVTALISVNETTKKDTYYSLKLTKGNVALDDKTTLMLDNLELNDYMGNSEDSDAPAWNRISFKRGEEQVYFEEEGMSLEEYKAELESQDVSEYTYKDKTLYVTTYNQDASESLQGRYSCILFESSDDIAYVVGTLSGVDPKEMSLDDYVSMCLDGVVEFR